MGSIIEIEKIDEARQLGMEMKQNNKIYESREEINKQEYLKKTQIRNSHL